MYWFLQWDNEGKREKRIIYQFDRKSILFLILDSFRLCTNMGLPIDKQMKINYLYQFFICCINP